MRGSVEDASVLGPEDKSSGTISRAARDANPSDLVAGVQSVQEWTIFMDQGQFHAQRAEWEHALRDFNNALSLCDSDVHLQAAPRYRHLVLSELGKTNRRFGRYVQAKEFLEAALENVGSSIPQVEASGELGVVYLHMNLLEDAKRAFELQYDTAKILGAQRAVCRAVGNLGMVNYQLSRDTKDNDLLDLAIAQLKERVETSRTLKASILENSDSSEVQNRELQETSTWEIIGLGRLSLCFTARGDMQQAIQVALEAVDLTLGSPDPTVKAITRFMYGRALLANGHYQAALEQFNPPVNVCTPAIAFCKEPSNDHRQNLRELVNAGADMDRRDEQGYSALDYAVFNGDTESAEIVLAGIRKTLEDDVEIAIQRRRTESQFRKNYREVFQERMRPVLLRSSGGADCFKRLRNVYAEALKADNQMQETFDGLKFLRYSDFLQMGSIRRSTDELVQQCMSRLRDNSEARSDDFVIFFSYRWIGQSEPDDETKTQYRRMVRAVNDFLEINPQVKKERLGIWVDWPCVDQDYTAPGVAALPMSLAQCNAMISLTDDEYYERAWCSVEVKMIQTLKRAYGIHTWYEHVSHPSIKGEYLLREGPMDLAVTPSEKRLRVEDDRRKILFLERQSTLLG